MDLEIFTISNNVTKGVLLTSSSSESSSDDSDELELAAGLPFSAGVLRVPFLADWFFGGTATFAAGFWDKKK